MIILFTTVLWFLVFVVLSFLVFYLPGFGLIKKAKEELAEQELISLSLVLGVVLFVITAAVLGLLNLRDLILPVILIVNLWVLIKFRWQIWSPWKILVKDRILLALLIAGILVQGFINFPSGFSYKEGLLFWSSQGHDGLWHVASMEQIRQSLPPQNPGFSGELLYNYHYLVDVLMGEFLRVFPFFSSLDLYFRFFPVVFSFMMGMTIFSLLARWKGNHQIGYLGLFFLYFTGSFGYIVSYFKGGGIFGGETAFWAAQHNTILGNPPHAISHSILPAFLLCFLLYLKNRNRDWFIISFLLGSVLAGFKVSGGLVMLVGLGFAALVDLIFYRRFTVVLLASLLGLSNFVTFKLMTRGAESFLMFLPWWFIRTTIVDRLGWMDLELRRQHYISRGTWQAGLRVMQLETLAFGIFLIGNLGMRVVGFIELVRKLMTWPPKVLKDPFEIALLASMLTGLVIPMLFVQKGIIYNNIQFMQYFLLIFGFYAAISTHRILTLLKHRWAKVIVIIAISAFALPTVIGNLVELYGPGKTPLSKVVNLELKALNYLKNNSPQDARVLTVPFNSNLKDQFKSQPRPIYAWYDTPYVSALSGRVSYLASEHVTLLGYPETNQRMENKKKFFSQQDLSWNRQFLQQEKISFIYVAKAEMEEPLDIKRNNLTVFFENDEVVVYKVEGGRS